MRLTSRTGAILAVIVLSLGGGLLAAQMIAGAVGPPQIGPVQTITLNSTPTRVQAPVSSPAPTAAREPVSAGPVSTAGSARTSSSPTRTRTVVPPSGAGPGQNPVPPPQAGAPTSLKPGNHSGYGSLPPPVYTRLPGPAEPAYVPPSETTTFVTPSGKTQGSHPTAPPC